MLVRLPIVIGAIPLKLIEDVWQTGTWLSAIMVTVAFLVGFLIGILLAVQHYPNAGILTVLPLAGYALVTGSLICTLLWAVIWLALLLFGWFLVFAGYCALIAGTLTSVGIAYVGFRASRVSEAKLDATGPR